MRVIQFQSQAERGFRAGEAVQLAGSGLIGRIAGFDPPSGLYTVLPDEGDFMVLLPKEDITRYSHAPATPEPTGRLLTFRIAEIPEECLV